MSFAERAAGAVPCGSLTGKLIAIVFAMSFGLLVAASLALYAGTLQVVQSIDDQFIDKRIAMVADLLLQSEIDVGALGHEAAEDSHGPRQLFVRIIAQYAPIALETPGIAKSIAASDMPDVRSAPFGEPLRATLARADGATFRVASVRLPFRGAPGYTDAIVQAATDTTLDRETLAWLRKLLTAVIVAGAPVTALASWLLVRRQLRPLREITTAAQGIDGATLEHRLALDGYPTELRDLGLQFNAMLGRLERTWLDLRTYADTVAHEMRTPLNRMQLRADLALRDGQSIDDVKACLAENVEECDRMIRLMQALLFLARVDSKQARIDPRELDIARELTLIAEYFEAPASAAGLQIAVETRGHCVVTADRELLQRAIGNLIENALAHTPRGGRITLSCAREADEAFLSVGVRDTGPGIAPAEQARIFERFYRGERTGDVFAGAMDATPAAAANSRAGLGLAIAKSIAKLHSGSLRVSSVPGNGAEFVMTLPVAPPDAPAATLPA